MGTWKNSLSFFTLSSESSERSCILGYIYSSLFLEIIHTEVDHFIIKVFSSKMGMAVSCFDFEYTFFNSEKRYIKSSTTKIENEDVLFSILLFIESISNSRCGRFVNNSENIDTSNNTSVFGCLSLWVIEVSRNCNNCLLHGLSKIFFGNRLHFLKNHWWNLFSLEFFSFSFMFYHNRWLFVSTWYDIKWP